VTWIHKCVGVRYAKKVESLGADAVTVVGYENGGATGMLNVTTMVLVPSTVDALKVPVIGGGGVIDGRGLYAVLALGAEGAIVGTRLVLTDECPVHLNLKKELLKSNELSTDLIMWSVGFTHRVWLNEPAKKALEIEKRGGKLEEIYPYVSGAAARKMYETGDINAGTVSVSQGVGLSKKIMPVKDAIEEMVSQAEEIHKRMGKMGMGKKV
jgi:NAD(P)H-dependent flavin oxidoreductase YrpB (nitropropane dioxygenase family)